MYIHSGIISSASLIKNRDITWAQPVNTLLQRSSYSCYWATNYKYEGWTLCDAVNTPRVKTDVTDGGETIACRKTNRRIRWVCREPYKHEKGTKTETGKSENIKNNNDNTVVKLLTNPHQTGISLHDDYQMYFLVTMKPLSCYCITTIITTKTTTV